MARAKTTPISKASFKGLADSCLKWFRRTAVTSVLTFHLAVEPVPASRPKFSKWGTHYGKNYTKFRREGQPLADAWDSKPITDNAIMVVLEHVVTKPKTGKKLWPRGDVDNYAKGPLDLMTKAKTFWTDDDQIVGLAAFKRYPEDGEKVGVYITWYEVEP